LLNCRTFSVSQVWYKCQGDPFFLSFLEFILMYSGPSNMCRIPSCSDGCAYPLHRSPAHSQCLQIASFVGQMSGDQVASGCEWCIFHRDEAQRSEYIIHGPAEDSLIIKNIITPNRNMQDRLLYYPSRPCMGGWVRLICSRWSRFLSVEKGMIKPCLDQFPNIKPKGHLLVLDECNPFLPAARTALKHLLQYVCMRSVTHLCMRTFMFPVSTDPTEFAACSQKPS